MKPSQLTTEKHEEEIRKYILCSSAAKTAVYRGIT
jgi:hypothetical protein